MRLERIFAAFAVVFVVLGLMLVAVSGLRALLSRAAEPMPVDRAVTIEVSAVTYMSCSRMGTLAVVLIQRPASDDTRAVPVLAYFLSSDLAKHGDQARPLVVLVRSSQGITVFIDLDRDGDVDRKGEIGAPGIGAGPCDIDHEVENVQAPSRGNG